MKKSTKQKIDTDNKFNESCLVAIFEYIKLQMPFAFKEYYQVIGDREFLMNRSAFTTG